MVLQKYYSELLQAQAKNLRNKDLAQRDVTNSIDIKCLKYLHDMIRLIQTHIITVQSFSILSGETRRGQNIKKSLSCVHSQWPRQLLLTDSLLQRQNFY
jgi:hypothetical protein